MTKQTIVKAMTELIEMYAKDRHCVPINKGTGHAFEKTFWDGIFTDNSEIPEIVAENEEIKFSIRVRSFWGCPELDIHILSDDNESGFADTYVIRYSDSALDKNGNYMRTENFRLAEVSVNTDKNHIEKMDRLFEMVDFIENYNGSKNK